ncbi:Nramp family divalent metal transporter [Actinophytocola xinjiangensis]|uniref:Nramp family divalent metal transporter n=1 Tax=Actinophytocola xinjiangensis TaxID=485602 RepID=UPI000AFCF194|nr:Nramp family divalent metal transporter [Actinophytocola xinjiangensis]
MNVSSTSGEPGQKRSFVSKLRYIGPAFIVGALTFGPGNAVSSATLGAESGYKVLWLLVISSVLMLAFTDMSARIAITYPTSIIQAIKDHIAKPAGVIAGICFFILAVTFGSGSMIGASLGLQVITGVDIKPLSAICAVAAVALLWTGGAYKRIEQVMIIAMAVMAVAFLATAVKVGPDLGDMAAGLVPSDVPGGLVAAFALLGTNLSLYSAFYMAYTLRDKGTTRADYRTTTRYDTIPGALLPGILTVAIIASAATVIPGATIESGNDMVDILRPALGSAAVFVFALGLFSAGFSSVMTGVPGGHVLSDALGFGDSIDHRRVRIMATVAIAASLGLVLIFGGAPIQLILVANAGTLILFPLLAGSILYLATRRRVMGDLTNRWWQTVIGVVGLAVVGWGAYRVAVELISG